MQNMISLAAISAMVGAALCLYRAWQIRQPVPVLALGGWALAALSALVWSFELGADRGVAVAVLSFMAVGLLLLAFVSVRVNDRDKRARKAASSGAVQHANFKVRQLALPVFKVVLVLSLACAVAAALTLALFALLWQNGVAGANNLALALLLFPSLWALLGAFILTGAGSLRRYLSLGLLLFIATGTVVITA